MNAPHNLSQIPPPAPSPPHRARSRRVLAVIAVVLLVLGVGVGIGVFAFNAQKSDTAPRTESTATPESPPREQTPSPSEDLVNEDTEVANPAPHEETGECPERSTEVYRGKTHQHSVKICANPDLKDSFQYVGGSDEKGYVILPATFTADPAGFWAENGMTTYTVFPDRLYAERGDAVGNTVLVDTPWVSGNMDSIGLVSDEGGPPCAHPGYDPELNGDVPACPDLAG